MENESKKSNYKLIFIIVAALIILGGIGFGVVNAMNSAKTQTTTHQDGTPHTEGDSHKAEPSHANGEKHIEGDSHEAEPSHADGQKHVEGDSHDTETKHEDGTAHTEGDSHQDESKPHTDVTPHE